MTVEQLLKQLDPREPPTNDDWLLNQVHAKIQTERPDVSVEHRNIVLYAVADTIRANITTALETK